MTIARVLNFDRSITKTRIADGAPCGQNPLLWVDGITPAMITSHYYQAPLTPLNLYEVPEATMFGKGWLIHDGQLVHDDDVMPRYVRTYFEQGLVMGRGTDVRALSVRQIDSFFSIWHFNHATYGHWLLEGVSKLFAMRYLLRLHPEYSCIPIVMPSDIPGFARSWINLLLPGHEVIYFNSSIDRVDARRALLLSWGLNYMPSPATRNEITSFAENYDGRSRRDRIFISRRIPSRFRRLLNVEEIMAIANRKGYTTIYPEDVPLEEQIAIFRNATHVIGEFGSALHNTIFSKPETVVVAMNWINAVQSRIGQAQNQRIGYLLQPSREPIQYNIEKAQVEQTYEISALEFSARIQDL